VVTKALVKRSQATHPPLKSTTGPACRRAPPGDRTRKAERNDLNILSGVQLVAGLVATVKGILDGATSNESIVAKGGGCCVSFQGLADDPTTMTEPTSPPPWFVREPKQAFVLNAPVRTYPERLRPRPRTDEDGEQLCVVGFVLDSVERAAPDDIANRGQVPASALQSALRAELEPFGEVMETWSLKSAEAGATFSK
jgi:hypothetical protein